MSNWGQSQGHIPRTRITSPDFFEWKGSSTPSDRTNTTTIAFQNVRGLNTQQLPLDISIGELVSNMDYHNITVLGLSEHHLSMSNHRTRQRVSETINRTRPGRILHQFNSSLEYEQSGRMMGGTGLIALAIAI